jgi:predicted dehydrogenase
MIKIGVIGAGHLGKIHLKILLELKDKYEVIGFYDPDRENAKIVNRTFRVKSFKSIEQLIEESDVVDIVSPTVSHFDCASSAIKANKHVFIERFNPAFKKAVDFIDQPLFIETHRLSEFNPRGTDVSVVLDLMIHDLDIILKIVKSSIKNISASGVAVISDTPDIANARIEFNNGCVCNLTASRMSLKNMRKTRVFQKDAYISIDLLEKKTEVIRLKNLKPSEKIDPLAIVLDLGKGKRKKQIYFENPEVEETNAIKDELESFHEVVLFDKEPVVTINDGLRALELAETILEKMKVSHQMNLV